MAKGPYRVGLVHHEGPRKGQIERAAQRPGIQVVQIACDHLHVAQLKGGHDRSCPLDRRLADIDADDPSGRADHLRQDRQHAEGPQPQSITFHPCWTSTLRNALRAFSAPARRRSRAAGGLDLSRRGCTG